MPNAMSQAEPIKVGFLMDYLSESRSMDDVSNFSEPLDLVFGRFDTPAAANALLARVRGVGYVDAEVRGDACGRWRVLYDGITSYDQGASSRDEARGAGLEAEVEIQPPG